MSTHTRLTLKDLARTEAMNRLKKLDAEAERIEADRAHIRRLIGGKAPAASQKATANATGPRKMSTAKRKEASERMSRIWAERRAAKATAAAAAAPETTSEPTSEPAPEATA